MSKQLSRYFTYEELTHSDKGDALGIDNTPSPDQLQNLTDTAQQADRVREFLGCPMLIESGFRSPKVNIAVKGQKNSAHLHGYAIDFTCPKFGSPRDVFNALSKFNFGYDQLILEKPEQANGGWIHVSFDPQMRGEKLVFDGTKYRVA